MCYILTQLRISFYQKEKRDQLIFPGLSWLENNNKIIKSVCIISMIYNNTTMYEHFIIRRY
jgi:hypothetical protein